MTYQWHLTMTNFYQHCLHLATQYKGRTRGIKLDGTGYWLRLHPTDKTKVEVLLYHYGYVSTKPAGNDKYSGARLPPKLRPSRVVATLDPDGVDLTNQPQYEQFTWEYSAEAYKAIPGIKPHTSGPWTGADNAFNRLLSFLGLYHCATRNDHPGTRWSSQSDGLVGDFIGPMRYTFADKKLTPLWPQPERVVDNDQRWTNNRALRDAFKQLKMRSKVGVEVTLEEMQARLAQSAPPYKALRNPKEFLRLAAGFEPTSHEAAVELETRAALIATGFKSEAIHAKYYLEGFTLTKDKHLRRLRAQLHKALGVVTYK